MGINNPVLINYLPSERGNTAETLGVEIKRRSDKLMSYFLIGYFVTGLWLATFYGTWLIAFGVGGTSLLAYYAIKIALSNSNLYQYCLSAVLGIFMVQFICQMHGMVEMHFFVFIASIILITYQDWTLQIPLLVIDFVYHAVFYYMEHNGFMGAYLAQLNHLALLTFIINFSLTAGIFFICGFWAYQLKKYNEIITSQILKMVELEKEAQLSTERKQNAEALNKLNEALQQQAKELAFSNYELEQFAYTASHDLQEPLRMITGFLARLEDKYSSLIDDRGKQYIHFAVDGAQRMRSIILELLAFSRAGKTEDKFEQVDIREIVTEIIGLYGRFIADTKAIIEFNNLPSLQTFKAPIRQVFQNLISNGLKYQKPGAVPVISIMGEEEADQWRFSVKDNGIGINSADFNKIFILFKRLHNNDEYSGNGMGLAVTKKIVENLGGKIWIESEEGKGSTFNFTILKKR